MAKEIFISYSRKDFDKVKAIKDEIDRELGIDCWFDVNGIESGEQFRDVIISAISNHNTVLFMLSTNSMQSEWALDELNFAKYKEKRIVLVYLEECKMTDNFYINYHKYDSILWNDPIQHDKLIRDLRTWFPPKKHNDSVTNFFRGQSEQKCQFHVIILKQNNNAVKDQLSIVNKACDVALRKLDVIHSDVDIMVSVLEYNHSIQWMYPSPCRIEDFKWKISDSSWGRNLGEMLLNLNERMSEKDLFADKVHVFGKSVVLLISDGISSDDTDEAFSILTRNPFFKKAEKYAINIGFETDLGFLARFTGKKKRVFNALNDFDERTLVDLLERLLNIGLYTGSACVLDDDDDDSWGSGIHI